MKRLIVLMTLAVMACAPEPEQAPPLESFRRDGALIGSALAFDAERFKGSWHQVAHYPGGCDGAQLQVSGAENGVMLEQLCGGAVKRIPLRSDGPGRFVSEDGRFWVLWVDADYRTLVIGRPNGTMGAIWNRSSRIPADRMTAAREILDFNGYDVSRLLEDSL